MRLLCLALITTKMKYKRIPLVFAITFYIFSGSQAQPEPLTAYQMINRAMKYVGDIQSKDLQLSIAIITPEGKNRGQSYYPGPPYRPYRIETRFEIDRQNGKEVAQFINPFNGFVFGGFHVLQDGRYTAYDVISSTARAIKSLGFENYRHFPHTYLGRALRDTANLVYEGVFPFREGQAHVVKLRGDRELKLFLDPKTFALLQIVHQTVNHPYGDGSTVKKYYDYREFGQLRLPTRFESGGLYQSWGSLLNSYEIVERVNSISLPDLNEFRQLDGDYAPAKMVSLAENIHMIQNIGDDKWGIFDYNVLVAEFEDHILVGEAPVSNAASHKAIAMIRDQFPSKPIRYLVQSHHHSDHVAGVRDYMAQEVTLVVASATQALFERIAKAPWRYEPDTLSKSPKEPKLLVINEPMTLRDGLNEATILNIGPIPHVNDMLAIYFPKQQLVWQADMITYCEWPLSIEPSVIFRERLSAYSWTVKTIAGTHGQVLKGKALEDYLKD